MTTTTKNLFAVEAQRFSQNAADALLKRGQLVEFLKSLNYEVRPYSGGYKALCPACKQSAIYIGTGGTAHKIFWKCYSHTCPTNTGQSRLVRNILGLVRGLVEDGRQTTAMEVIRKFIGARTTWDITNGKLGDPKVSPTKTDYVFVVTNKHHLDILTKAGFTCVLYSRGSQPEVEAKRLLCLIDKDREAIADQLRQRYPDAEIRVNNPHEMVLGLSFDEHLLTLARRLINGVPDEYLDAPF